jgi:thiol-disulfide isomerase/thioredoxin
VTTSKKKTAKPQARTGSKATQQQSQPRKIPWLGIAFGAIALALVGAIAFSSDEAIGSEFGDVTVDGALPPFVDPATDSAIGMPAPEVEGEDFDGNTVVIENDGTAKAVVFLAHWCPHCQAEVPKVQAWLDDGGGVEGVEIVSVTTSMNSAQPNYPPSEWLDRENWTSPVIRDDSDSTVLRSYGSGGFPYWVFVAADGSVTRRSAGQLDIPTLEAFMTEAANA